MKKFEIFGLKLKFLKYSKNWHLGDFGKGVRIFEEMLPTMSFPSQNQQENVFR